MSDSDTGSESSNAGRTSQRIHESRGGAHEVLKELVSMGSAFSDLASALKYMLTTPGNLGASSHELAERNARQRRGPNLPQSNLLVTILEKRATSTGLEDEARATANKAAAGLKAMLNVNIEVPDAAIDDALRITDGRSDDSGLG
jgi:hypothetical protein